MVALPTGRLEGGTTIVMKAVRRERFQRALGAKSELRDPFPGLFLSTLFVNVKVTVTMTQIVHKFIFRHSFLGNKIKQMIASNNDFLFDGFGTLKRRR